MIDLAEWNLTVPVPLPVAQVTTAELNSSNFRSPYLYRGEGGSLVFWVPVTGTPQAFDDYPATELRETRPDGSAYSWKYREADALLQAEAAVQQVPSRPEVILSQIEDQTSAPLKPAEAVLQLVYRVDSAMADKGQQELGKLIARLRESPDDDPKDVILLERLPLASRFSYDIKLARSGVLTVRAHGAGSRTGDLGLQLDSAWSSHHLYFKAGARLRDAEGPASEGGKVQFYRLISMHQPNNR
ncbi:polysaccharide lyase family 7 protein [uncultured Pseudomonas sp.]|uniref:polysaccharide lyase family 7 protein n=1 Tax=uncultured Pseudomonas sp. TaxID=114707 RepID=UPI0025DDE5C5|nr:polysaccharide lyase family 7 protein [uncultured Pseudomonas sp.]